MVVLALRPEFPTPARMPPTARSAPRGGRPGPAVLTAGLVCHWVGCRTVSVVPVLPVNARGIESLALRALPMRGTERLQRRTRR
jgi:hypothetical protein